MGLITRAAGVLTGAAVGVVVGVVLSAVLTACGGSVADADRRAPVRATPLPQTPFCAAAQANSEAIRPLNELVSRGNVTAGELADTVDAVRRAGAEMVNTAPEEIRTDVERAVQAQEMQLDVLVANSGDPAALSRDPELSARLRSPEFAGAGDRVRSYVERTCTITSPTG